MASLNKIHAMHLYSYVVRCTHVHSLLTLFETVMLKLKHCTMMELMCELSEVEYENQLELVVLCMVYSINCKQNKKCHFS